MRIPGCYRAVFLLLIAVYSGLHAQVSPHGDWWPEPPRWEDAADRLAPADRARAAAQARYMLARIALADAGPDAQTVASDHLAAGIRATGGDPLLVQEYALLWSLQPEDLARRTRRDFQHLAWRRPDAAVLTMLVAAAYRQDGDGDGAVRLLRRAAIAADWTDPAVVVDLAATQLKLDETWDAHQTLQHANRPDRCAGDWRYESYAALFYSLAIARDRPPYRWYRQRFERLARQHALAAAAVAPDDGGEMVFRVAQALVMLDEHAAAIRTLAPSLAQSRLGMRERRLLVSAYEATGAADQVLAMLSQMSQDEPTDDRYLLASAAILHSQGDLAAAIAACTEALERRPRQSTWERLGRLRLEAGEPRQALAAAKKLSPHQPHRHALRAAALFQLGRHRDALTILAAGEATVIAAGNRTTLTPAYYLQMAEAAALAGEPGAQGHALRLGLQAYPADPSLQQADAQWRRLHDPPRR